MKIVYFTHSLVSCWNHGNAHFVRGVLGELGQRGHHVVALAPADGWSVTNLIADHGPAATAAFHAAYPALATATFDPALFDAAAEGAPGPAAAREALTMLIDDADLVIVHEWNDPRLVAALGGLRRDGRFTLLFHDTHHRAVSEPGAMRAYDLSAYDGVLAFGEALSAVYRDWGWGGRVWTWHEAADTRLFHPPGAPAGGTERKGLVWIGNWGDGERAAELEQFLLGPAQASNLALDIYGVRYPPEARAMLARYGAAYHGWLANFLAPAVFARHLATVHVPRRYYATMLPGIPTIRVFEALACGIPLICAPWDDAEGLFSPGLDYLVAADGDAVRRHLTALIHEPDLCRALAEHGVATITARHSCAHRADELLAIVGGLDGRAGVHSA